MNDRAEMISGEVVRRLAELRKKKGMSQREVAEKAGLHKSYIGLLEQGLRRPTLEVLLRLGTALDVKISSLLIKAETLWKDG